MGLNFKKPQVSYSLVSSYVNEYETHIDIIHVVGTLCHTKWKVTVHQVPETVDCCAGCLQQGNDDGGVRRREEQGQQQQGEEYDPG